MSDIGALILTLGEPTTEQALASVRSQSVPIDDVRVLEGVRPFHRALNVGAARITTPFFMQVDADFLLDSECAITLRQAMEPGIGVVVGPLLDPLMGRISGVKLFRSQCFASLQVPDTVTPDVDFLGLLERDGWQTRFVVGRRRSLYHLGEHRPAYTVDYVYGTYYLLGARYVHQGDALALLWRLDRLRRSRHPLAIVARMAMGHGVFSGEVRDVPKPMPTTEDSDFLRELTGRARDGSRRDPLHHLLGALEIPSQTDLLHAFLVVGASLRETSLAGFRDCLHALAETRHRRSWLAEMALAHGALANSFLPVPRRTMATLEQLGSPTTPKLFPRPA